MTEENPPEPPSGDEALRLKELAEQKYTAGNLKSALKYAKRAERLYPSLDGVSEMITAFKILRTAGERIYSTSDADSGGPTPPDYYKILQVERFAHINSIKKEYKKLALILHPDKNPFLASEEAFKHVGEAFRVLSDKIRRKEFDMKVRIAMQEAAAGAGAGVGEIGDVVTFWTLCSTCRLLHKFERKYLGHSLVCPSCRKSFKAVEVDEEKATEALNERAEPEALPTRVSERIQAKKVGKTSSIVEGSESTKGKGKELGNGRLKGKWLEMDLGAGNEKEGFRSSGRREIRSGGMEVIDRTRAKRAKVVDDEETLTLAEMWLLAKKKGDEEKTRLKGKEKEKEIEMLLETEKGNETEKLLEMENAKEDEVLLEMEKEQEKEMEKVRDKEKLGENEKEMSNGKVKEWGKSERHGTLMSGGLEIVYRRASKSKRISEIGKGKISRQHDLEVTLVEEPSLYNFDKDRQEKSFKKGQVWAVYEYSEGMPRNYVLVEEIVSVNPFEVRLSWLEFHSNGDEQFVWDKRGFCIPCGKFKVSDRILVKSLKMFSHVADFERIARELYWIYPKKGSVWALYNENMLDSEEKYSYSIVVLLTTYTDQYGMSVAYLVKVDGFRTVFKRWEVGAGAPLWLDRDDFRLFSHQIPSKKLSGNEASGLTGDCWELDSSALPPEPLANSFLRY